MPPDATPTTAPFAATAAERMPGADDETPLVTLESIRVAAEGLRGVATRTPLLRVGGLDVPGPPLYVKPESLQPIGAFKLRGAYTAIARLTADRRAAGVVTHSSGNHAQGVARGARMLGVRAVIVMPSDAPAVKVAGVRADGAQIVVVGPSSEERAERAFELARDEGLTLIPPYDHPDVIAGQGTVGLEIAEQVAEIDRHAPFDAEPPLAALRRDGATVPLTVLVPIGGGGLASGVATALKALRPDARVVGVEPDLAADARDSLASGRLVRWEPALVGRTIADGMRTASLGRLPFAHLRRSLDAVVTVSESEITRAMARAADQARLVLEPSGATSLAAWWFHGAEVLPGGFGGAAGRVVCVLSGGNVDPERYFALVAEGRAAGG